MQHKDILDLIVKILQFLATAGLGVVAYRLQSEFSKKNNRTFAMNCMSSQFSNFSVRNAHLADRVRNLCSTYRTMNGDEQYQESLQDQIEVFFQRFILNCGSQIAILEGTSHLLIGSSKDGFAKIASATNDMKLEVALSRVTLAKEVADVAKRAKNQQLITLAKMGAEPELSYDTIADLREKFKKYSDQSREIGMEQKAAAH